MFKHISEIISQFSTPQKVIALALVLFSIVIISVAPSLISAITVDRTDLNKSIEDKKEIIRELENELKNKNLLIISNGRSCTDEILKREQEFIGMLGQIKKDLKKKEEEKPLIYESSLRIGNNDSTLKMMILPAPEVNVVTKKSNLKPIIKKIEMMEEKIHH
jgi:hypothetical protein